MNAAGRKRRATTPALDLIEEAVALLRRTPAATLLVYLVGAVPFWLGLLYFFADMSHNAYALRNLPEWSLAVALLYLWMKCWQTVFTTRLRVLLTAKPDEPWTSARILRMVAAQALWHPWGFLIRPVGLVITFPYGWLVAFFQNVTVLGDGREHAQPIFTRACTQAKLWPGQNHLGLSVLWIFGLFVWLNVSAVLGAAPTLLKMFFGMETAFSRSVEAYMNTTFLTATIALAALFVDPLWKALYVLRCFHGTALHTGEDLSVELRQIRRSMNPSAVAALVLLALCSTTISASAQTEPPRTTTVAASELDERISEVLERREYAWRAPRELSSAEEKTWLGSWISGVAKALQRVAQKTYESIAAGIRWLRNALSPNLPTASGNVDWVQIAKALFAVFAIAAVAAIVWLVWRVMRTPRLVITEAAPAPAAPNLEDENVAADQLPEQGWLQLARDYAARGEFQLALRAAWLAGLAHLGERQLLSIARYKSNRDYDRELRRRARTQQELISAFEENLLVFERAWYGRHAVTPEHFDAFTGNLERIRTC